MAKNETIQLKLSLTINEKLNILKIIDEKSRGNKPSGKELAKILQLPRSTISTILSNRRSIESIPISETNRCRSKNKKRHPKSGIGKYNDLEKELVQWLSHQDGNKVPIRGMTLRKKAKQLANDMGLNEFSASNGWYDRFRKRFKNILAVNSECDHNTVEVEGVQPEIRPEDFLNQLSENGLDSNRERQTKTQQYQALSSNLLRWDNLARSNGIKVTGAVLKEMALALAGALGVTTFTASNGWIDKYQKRRDQTRARNCTKCHMSR